MSNVAAFAVEKMRWFKCKCGALLPSANSGGRLWCSRCQEWHREIELVEVTSDE